MSPRAPPSASSSATSSALRSTDTSPQPSQHDDILPLHATATADMCYHCFDALISELHAYDTLGLSKTCITTAKSNPTFVNSLLDPKMETPLFVTWEKQKRNNRYELRGCIGTLSAKQLRSAIGEYAVVSAVKDRRFAPINATELPKLRVAVSLLVCYEPCDLYDWQVGTHGVVIRWSTTYKDYSATYLPEVAGEQGWDVPTTVQSLIRKAGYHGDIDADLISSLHCTRYQSSKVQVTFAEYAAHRNVQSGGASWAARDGAHHHPLGPLNNNNCRIM